MVGAPDASFTWAAVTMARCSVWTGGRSVFFDAKELEVHAIALAPGGGLYAATSPDGKIYKVDATGKGRSSSTRPTNTSGVSPWTRPATSSPGPGQGHHLQDHPDGKARRSIRRKPRTPCRWPSIAKVASWRHRSPGRVFQIDASGKPFVLLDSPYNEIHKLRVDRRATSTRPRSTAGRACGPDAEAPEPAPQPIATVSTEVTSITIVADVGRAAQRRPAPPRTTQGQGAGRCTASCLTAHRISSGSCVTTPRSTWPSRRRQRPRRHRQQRQDYRLSGDPMQPTLVARALVQQVTHCLRTGQDRCVRDIEPGKLLRLSAERATTGTCTSDVRDAQAVATWGAVKWQGTVPTGTRVEISTRSGNTRTPDETWSDWSSAYSDAAGSPIVSPRARYLQWRAVLTASRDQAPILTSVTAAYLPRNSRPRVASITIHPPGTVFQRPFPTGDPEIAASRATRQTVEPRPRIRAHPEVRRLLDDAPISGDCSRSSGERRMRTAMI